MGFQSNDDGSVRSFFFLTYSVSSVNNIIIHVQTDFLSA